MTKTTLILSTIAFLFGSSATFLFMTNIDLRNDRNYLESELMRAKGLADKANEIAEHASETAEKYASLFVAREKQVMTDRLYRYIQSIPGRKSTKSDFQIAEAIVASSYQYNMPIEDISALAQIESHFDRYAVSETGARGVMQLVPSTAQELGVKDAHDVVQNVRGGSEYFYNRRKTTPNVEAALIKYSGGQDPEYIRKWYRARRVIALRLSQP